MNQSTTTTGTKLKVKIVLLGDQHVGKSCIIDKYINGKFDPNCSVGFSVMQPTVGIDFLAKNVFHKGKSYRLQLWDTAGQERFRSLIPSYLKDALSAIIVFDVSNKASLKNAASWLQLYNDQKLSSGFSMLVGNKIDLPYRAISTAEGRAMAERLGVGYAQVSAKTGEKIEEMFTHLVDMLAMGKTNGEALTGSAVTRQSSVETVSEPVPAQVQTLPKTLIPPVMMVSSLPKEYEKPTDTTNQPLSRDHDTIVKNPMNYQQSATHIPAQRGFEKYPAQSSYPSVPAHYNQHHPIIIPPPLPAGTSSELAGLQTETPIVHINQLQPNIILNSRVVQQQEQASQPKKRCCRSS